MATSGQDSVSQEPKVSSNAVQPDTNVDPASERPPDPDVAYSIFKPWQKKLIVATASLGSVFSPMATTIYLPALNVLAKDLHVSNSEINLTVTTFQIVQGIAPALIAGFSDTAGRRPAYVFCFTVFIAANIGLALQRDYAALMVLRCLQSAGSSGTIALAQGVVSDVATSAERGTYVAYNSIATITGPILGPILGGILAQYGGWPWIFYFQIIAPVSLFIPMLLFLPETCRKVVGDGSVPPPTINRCLTNYILEKHRRRDGKEVDPAQIAEVRRTYKLSIPNPISTLKILADKEKALILFCAGMVMACNFAVLTGMPSQFAKIFKFNELQIGLVFIPFGAGSILSAFTTGKLIDFSWRRNAKKAGFPVVKNRYQDLTFFPVESARLTITMPLLYISCAGLITYGWLLFFRVPLAGPLVALFIIGYGIMAGFQTLQILIVDLCPGEAAAATAANNLVRCLLGAGSTAVVIPLIQSINVGWTYTLAAFIWIAMSPLLVLLIKFGPRWRQTQQRRKNEDTATRTRESAIANAVDEEPQIEKSGVTVKDGLDKKVG